MRYVFPLVVLLSLAPAVSGQIVFLPVDAPTLQVGGGYTTISSTSGLATELTALANGRIGFQLGAGFFTTDVADENDFIRNADASVRSFSVGPVFYPSRQTDDQALTVALGVAYVYTTYPDLDIDGTRAIALALDVARNVTPDETAGGMTPHLGAGISFQQQPGGGSGNAQVFSFTGGVEFGVRLAPGIVLVGDPSVSVAQAEGTRSFGLGLRVALGFSVDAQN